VSSLVAQNRLQASNTDLQTALTRLSTGLRINRGADDPAGLIASEALRSEITSINKALANTNRANQIISTADSALGQVSKLLNDIRGLVVEAANNGALSDDEIAANQLQIDSSLEAINRIAQTTTFQGRKLLDGSLDFETDVARVAAVTDLQIDQANLGTSSKIDVDIDISAAATRATSTIGADAFTTGSTASGTTGAFTTAGGGGAGRTFTFTSKDNDADLNGVTINVVAGATTGTSYDSNTKELTVSVVNGDTLANIQTAVNSTSDFDLTFGGGGTGTETLTVGAQVITATTSGGADTALKDDVVFQLSGTGGSDVFTFNQGASIEQVAAAINLVKDGTSVEATVNAGAIDLNSIGYGSSEKVAIEIISEGAASEFNDSVSTPLASGTDIVATINGIRANSSGNILKINTSTLDLSLTVADGTTNGFSFSITGGGAQFQLGPDVVSNQQARLGITSLNTGRLGGSAGRLYELASGQAKQLTGDITGAAEVVDQVINKVTSLRGRLGAFQATTLDSNTTSLNETLANLREAESSIRDADFAVESANLTRAQILVQSGTNVLALANQNPQNVLALLR
ncbi:MAG: flagellin, partial [Planctomycetota bacterium]